MEPMTLGWSKQPTWVWGSLATRACRRQIRPTTPSPRWAGWRGKKTKQKKKHVYLSTLLPHQQAWNGVFGFTALWWQKRLYLVVNIQWFQMRGPQGKRLLMQIQQSSGSGRAAFCQSGGRSRWESLSKLHSVSFKSDTWKRFGLCVLKKKNVQEENGHGQAINCVKTLPDSN